MNKAQTLTGFNPTLLNKAIKEKAIWKMIRAMIWEAQYSSKSDSKKNQ